MEPTTLTAITAGMATAASAAKSLGSFIGAYKDLKDKQPIIDAQNALIDAQGAMSSLLAEHTALVLKNGELEKKLAASEDWKAFADNYALVKITDHIFVYDLKPDRPHTGAQHYLCPHCFDNHKKSILQKPGRYSHMLHCHECKMDIQIEEKRQPQFATVNPLRHRTLTY